MKTIKIKISLLLLLIYGLFLIKVIVFKYISNWTTFSEHISQLDSQLISRSMQRANFVPLKTIIQYLMSDLSRGIIINNLVGNLVLFIPYGMLIGILIDKFVWKAMVVGLLTSLGFELIQLTFVLGSFDIDDIILNTIGALIGISIVKYWNKLRVYFRRNSK